MNQLIYFFLLLISSLNFKQSNNINWLFICFALILVSFKKYGLKFLFSFNILLLFILILDSKIKKWPLKNQINGQVVETDDYYFVIKNNDYKVLIYGDERPKLNQKISYEGKSYYFLQKNFYDFDYFKYYGIKNIAFYMEKGKITTNYSRLLNSNKNNYFKPWIDLVFLNKKTKQNRNYYNVFLKIGLSHIIIISSYHFKILFEWITFVFSIFINFLISKFLAILFLFYLTWILNFSSSATKALLFAIIYFFLGKFKSKIWCLSLSGIIFVLFKPQIVGNNGFLMTYGFSFLLMLYSEKNKWIKLFLLKMMGSFIELVFSGQIALFNFFYILLSPIIFLIYGAIFLKQRWILEIIFETLKNISQFNFYFVIGIFNLTILIYFLLLIKMIYDFFNNSFWKWISFLLIISLLLITKNIKSNLEYMTFINVGQGDSFLIKTKKEISLIDVGGVGSYQKNIKPYLLKEGINKIDKISISHPHFDHNGGLKNWDKDIQIKNLKKNSMYAQELNLKKWKTVNDNSSVLLFSYRNINVLFTGDITNKVERYLIKKYPLLRIDILKVAHHGSKYSSSLDFLNHFKPRYAIISVGKNNYNHPHVETIKKLKSVCKKVFITKNHGAIKYDFKNKTFETSNYNI